MKYVLAVLTLLAAGSSAFAQAPGSKLYIPPPEANKTVDDGNKVVTTNGAAFNLVLQAELVKEGLPLTLVTDAVQADYKMQWAAIPEEGTSHGNGSLLFHSVSKELYTVSASLVGKDNQVVWAGSVDKKNLHDCAVVITKQLKDSMKGKKS